MEGSGRGLISGTVSEFVQKLRRKEPLLLVCGRVFENTTCLMQIIIVKAPSGDVSVDMIKISAVEVSNES